MTVETSPALLGLTDGNPEDTGKIKKSLKSSSNVKQSKTVTLFRAREENASRTSLEQKSPVKDYIRRANGTKR